MTISTADADSKFKELLNWNKWLKPSTNIDGAFVAMLANSFAMLAAYYLLPQPKDWGWVGLDAG